MEWKEQVHARFSQEKDADKWQKIYAENNPGVDAQSFQRRRDFTVDYILKNVARDSVILDAGCGAAPVLKQLVNQGYQLMGMDYSPDMLELAKQTLGDSVDQVVLQQGDCEAIQQQDQSVDCVVCLGVISYVSSIPNAMKEIERILKPGGIALVSYRNAFNEIFMDPVAWVAHPFRAKQEKVIGRALSRSEVLQALATSRLQLIDEFQTGFGALRWNKKVISDGRLAKKVTNILHKIFRLFRLKRIYRQCADIHILVLKK
jgi:ubiquinone/menaquinone biosynthesis C-methylase UbiE